MGHSIKVDYRAAMNAAAQSLMAEKVDRQLKKMSPEERENFYKEIESAPVEENVLQGEIVGVSSEAEVENLN